MVVKRWSLLLLFLPVMLVTHCGRDFVPPRGTLEQPLTGPGGREYSHASVLRTLYQEGTDEAYWLFEPADPTPASAPVVIFLHGWGALNPAVYGAWIKHLVRRGNIVVYPLYQTSFRTSMLKFTPNAVAAVQDAFRELQTGSHVRPELNHVAVVGHSMGGAITPNLAALAPSSGIPQPKAIMPVEPGNFVVDHPEIAMPMEDLTQIPSDTLMLVVVGADDEIAGQDFGKSLFYGTPQIPPENKDFVEFLSDYHGDPPLIANHYAPLARDDEFDTSQKESTFGFLRDQLVQQQGLATVDAFDYYGFWKLFDALIETAFRGKYREYALGGTPEQEYMGTWSDGTPVRAPIVTDQP